MKEVSISEKLFNLICVLLVIVIFTLIDNLNCITCILSIIMIFTSMYILYTDLIKYIERYKALSIVSTIIILESFLIYRSYSFRNCIRNNYLLNNGLFAVSILLTIIIIVIKYKEYKFLKYELTKEEGMY